MGRTQGWRLTNRVLRVPTNNYCKWFQVCEHIWHHCGQIAFLRKRVPGADKTKE
jgi:hypothetical protein